jgi:hypothetical protein
MRNQLALFILLSLWATSMLAQFTPVTITGFNHDIVAESGTSSLAVTSTQIDGPSVTASNNVLYSAGFAATNSISAGGLPDAGVLSSTTAGSYALAAYTVASRVRFLFKPRPPTPRSGYWLFLQKPSQLPVYSTSV